MTTISSDGDVFLIHAPGKNAGDIIKVLDEDNVGHDLKLSSPVGDGKFLFKWAAAPAPQQQGDDNTDGYFKKNGEEWLIKTHNPHSPGDKVVVSSNKGPQECTLGESVGDNLFKVVRKPHFLLNPVGDNPKWVVRVYDADAKPGDTVEVHSKGRAPQKKILVSEVKTGFWTCKKA